MAGFHPLPETSELLSQILALFSNFPFISFFSSQLLLTRVGWLHLSCTCPISAAQSKWAGQPHTACWVPDSQITSMLHLKHANMTMSRPAALFPAEYPTRLNQQTFWIKKPMELDECCRRKRAIHVEKCLHKLLPGTTSYYKTCTQYVPVQLRTTKLAQSTSQYYFVLQSLQKVLPSTTSYYKACTKYFPVLLRTTKLAQVLPSTTSYNKACTKYFPVLLRTTKLAHSTSQDNFVLQSLHKVLPSTSSYYKACTQYVPVLLRTTKLAQSTSQYYFVLHSLDKVLPSTTSY